MVKRIFIDTNVWLRFILKDNENQFEPTSQLITLVEEGKLRPYISTIVLLEIACVLKSFYKISKNKIIEDLYTILETRNITIIEKTNFKKSLELSKNSNLKLSDSVIISSLPKEILMCTWDEEIKKVPSLNALTPKEILEKFDNFN